MTTPPVDLDDADIVELSDEELTELALAADIDAPLPADAVPLSDYVGDYPELLPSWYMPRPTAVSGTRRRSAVVALIIVALISINAFGLCITSGHLEIPF